MYMYSRNTVRQWIETDPDEGCRAELTELLEAAETGDEDAANELSDRFSSFLQFGTAGLRGPMAAGPFRMNRAVVRKAAAGLADYLLEKVGEDAFVVVGYDARHNSREFAADTAAIVTAAGMRAAILPRALPTPILAYAVRALGADAGVMVTASHNPANDNGYKVYLGGRCTDEDGRGVQLVPPADAEIAEKIAATGPAAAIPLAESYTTIGEDLIDSYVEECARLVKDAAEKEDAADPGLTIVYTAMHGVGAQIMRRVFAAAGFRNVVEVTEQCEPDPDFPTVAFPNPEEAGALDLAIAKARDVGADLIIASDPDADRCSAAVPDGDGWRQLSGDEIGSILGEYIAANGLGARPESPGTVGNFPAAAGTSGTHANAPGTFANSIVSSRLLGRIAAAHGVEHRETLTGFKWIARVHEIAYGYEEAIGFCVNPAAVRDKDGICAGIVLASVASRLARAGSSLVDELDRLYALHGVYLTGPVTVRVEDLSIIGRTMAKVRREPPASLAGSPVVRTLDLSGGSEELPPTDAIVWYTEANDRVVIRPSGTEPKVKCYLEVCSPVGQAPDSAPSDPAALARAKEAAAERLQALKADVSSALKL